VTLRKPFRTFSRTGKRLLLGIKKFHRAKPEARKEAIGKLKELTDRVVKQASKVVNTLYSQGHQASARQLNRLVCVGKRIVAQTEEVLQGKKPAKRLYSLHEKDVAVIKKGKSFPACEFGSLVSLAKNDDGLILSHQEYQRNMADVKTLGEVLRGIKRNTGRTPEEVTADRGFDQSFKKQENCRRRWGANRMAIPKKGKRPHPDSKESWFRKALKQRVKIEPIIGHLKCDHRMNRCRYRGKAGDTVNVVWATLAWNTKKITQLARVKEERLTRKALPLAA